MQAFDHAVISQEKLSPLELSYLDRLIARNTVGFHKFGGPVADLTKMLKQKLNPARRWSPGARYLFRRIVNVVSSGTDEIDHVRLALLVGPRPRLNVYDISAPTACAVLDTKEGVIRRGWLHGLDDKIFAIPSGMQIVSQRTGKPFYEDWVGMGAPESVVPASLTDNQWNRAWNFVRDYRPFINPRPAAVLTAAPT